MEPPQIAILGAGIFVRTEYIPRLAEISDLFILRAIWSRTEVEISINFLLYMFSWIFLKEHPNVKNELEGFHWNS